MTGAAPSGPVRMPVLSAHCLDPAPIMVRPAAARAGGFDRIGLSLSQVRSWLDGGGSLDALDRELDRHGVTVAELEALELSADPGEREKLAVDLARRWDVRYLQAVPPGARGAPAADPAADPGMPDQLAEAFAALCDRLEPLTVGLEPLPWTSVPDLAAASAIVKAADRGNGGVCLDVWHHFRHGGYLAAIAPHARRLVAVQLADGVPDPAVADPLADCLDARLPPGTGSFPLAGLLELLGPDVYLTVEVLSADLRSGPPAGTARRLGSATRALLGLAETEVRASGVGPEVREAITTALAAAARLADEKRPDALADRFTEDCRVSYSPRSTVRGRDALRDYLRDALDRYTATSHLLGLPEIVADGPDGARSLTTVQGWHRLSDGAQIVLHGRYVDRWERAPDGWLIADRRLEISGAVGRDTAGFHPLREVW